MSTQVEQKNAADGSLEERVQTKSEVEWDHIEGLTLTGKLANNLIFFGIKAVYKDTPDWRIVLGSSDEILPLENFWKVCCSVSVIGNNFYGARLNMDVSANSLQASLEIFVQRCLSFTLLCPMPLD